MKFKFLVIILISVMVFCTLSNTIIKTCTAESKNDAISIEDMSYEVLKTEKTGPYTIVYYKLIITLHNSGGLTSDDLTVVIIDDDATKDFPGIKTRVPNPDSEPLINIPPGESKDFIFGEKTEWMIVGTGKHVLTVNVHPNNNESVAPICTKRFTINSNGESGGLPATSTPGFEILAVLTAVFIIFLFNKKRKK